MTDRNRAAVDVQFCVVDAQLALAGERLRGEPEEDHVRSERAYQRDCLTDAVCYTALQMRETLTISLPKELRRGLEKMAKAEGVTSSEYVRRALKADIFRRAMRAARRELVPQARAKSLYTDEDVFKTIS